MALGFEDIDDTICTNCGGDNMTDYPVCPHCAKRLHFDYRVKLGRTCLHCVYVAKKEESNGDQSDHRRGAGERDDLGGRECNDQ